MDSNFVTSFGCVFDDSVVLERIVGVVDPGLVATDLTGGKGRDPESVGELFVWAGTNCPAEELDGEIVTLREWRVATR